MSTNPRLLDLFCGAGGASKEYALAGFDVTGVDNKSQKHYPYKFVMADAIEYLLAHGHEYDAITASPPCQRYSDMTQEKDKGKHPDLIGPTRDALREIGKPYVIENVEGARWLMVDPVILCGTMFGLKVLRHRCFESSVEIDLSSLPACNHSPAKGMPRAGYGASKNGFVSVAGHFSNVQAAREAMGIDWMVRDELAQAIPPAYTQFIGEQLIGVLTK